MARSSRLLSSCLFVLLLAASPAWAQFHRMPGYTTSTLPANPPVGAQAVVTDGGAAGAPVVGDGSQWRCADQIIRRVIIVTCPPYNAKGDGVTDDTVAINAAFAAARALGRNVEILIPTTASYYLVTSSIDAGGFGNAPPTVRGGGSKNTGSKIHGKFSTAGQAVVDFSGNEGGQILDITIEGDSTTTPDYGLLIAGAIVGGGTRGGANYLQNVKVGGAYKVAAVVNRSADLVVFNHVIAGLQVPSGSAGVALYIVNGAAVTPIYPISSAFRTLSDATGLTAFTSMNGIYSLAGNAVGGTTNRAAWLIEGVSRQVNSTNDIWVCGGITGTAIEAINGTGSLFATGFTHESGGGSFIKTDGFKNSMLVGYAQKNGATPIIDADASYGRGNGIISGSLLQISPSGTGANLFNTASANTGLLSSQVWLLDNANLIMSAGQTGGNTIYNYNGTGTVTLSPGYLNTILTHGLFTLSPGLTYDGTSLKVSGVGPHVLGGVSDVDSQLLITGTRVAGAGHDHRALDIQSDLTGVAGLSLEGINLRPTFHVPTTATQAKNFEGLDILLTVPAGTGTVGTIDGVLVRGFAAPAGTTNANGVWIYTAPTGATTNRALRVGGVSEFEANILVGGNAITFTDSALSRSAANILDLKNGTNAQTFRVYGTTTNSTYTELYNDGVGNAGLRTPSGPGGGNIIIATESNAPIYLRTNGAYRWIVDGGGNFYANTDGGPDIGALAANRPNNIYSKVGFGAAGIAGQSVTTTVRAAGGAADCTLIFTGGLKTGGTC